MPRPRGIEASTTPPMADWRQINAQIIRCRASADPVECLTRLFGRTSDGHVAFALAETLKARGALDEAARWFDTAEQRYPLAKYKQQARAARQALGLASSRPSASTVPKQATSLSSERQPGPILYIVNCTGRKIWDDPDSTAASYVPA